MFYLFICYILYILLCDYVIILLCDYVTFAANTHSVFICSHCKYRAYSTQCKLFVDYFICIIMNIISRIRQIIEFKNISARKFCVEIGVANGFLDKVKDVGSEKVSKILYTYPEINPEWLICGVGNMLREVSSEAKHSEVNKLANEKIIYNSPDQEVPLYDISAAAGCIMLFQDGNSIVPIDTIKIPNLAKCDGAIFARGDSMYPIIKSGDLILYKIMQGFDTIIWGETYIVCYESYGDFYTVVKYVKRSIENEGHIVLLSQNEHHQPFEIHISQVKSMALVRASVRYNNM